MSRTVERSIDLLATLSLLLFAWLLKDGQPALAGIVVANAVQFWLRKNADSKNSPAHIEAHAAADSAAALVTAAGVAAAEVIKTALAAKQEGVGNV